ncbi:hypothetical protein A2U01_0113132, partial [Trifolium medium]|nr:hypothetical protein [Trifolium medium]
GFGSGDAQVRVGGRRGGVAMAPPVVGVGGGDVRRVQGPTL